MQMRSAIAAEMSVVKEGDLQLTLDTMTWHLPSERTSYMI
jgi:hypothetical protein